MKDLIKWQIASFLSRGVAMTFGIVQSIVIVRILSVAEYGFISIAISIGGAFGVYQHLGLASGSTREISSAESDEEVYKIFITSAIIRYCVTIPLAIILFSISKYLAVSKYSATEIITPLRIFALVLLIQGIQSIFNSIISGTQRFKQLFLYQMAIAFVSLFIYLPLIYVLRVDGYFIALAIFNLIGSISIGIIALKPLKGSLVFPRKKDFVRLLKDILSISLGIYVVKIIYTYWQKSGPILLGLSVSPEEVGIFSFALLYAAKLMTVSDAVTDVNLPILSRKFTQSVDEFKVLFAVNFDKVFAFIIVAAVSAVYWSSDLIRILIGSSKYDQSVQFIFPLVYAFIFYSLVNIIKSSIVIPAKMIKEMIFSFGLMLIATGTFYFMLNPYIGFLASMSFGMVFGSFVGFISLTIATYIKLRYNFLKISHSALFVVGLIFSLLNLEFSLAKFGVYFMFLVVYLLMLFQFKVIEKDHLVLAYRKINSFLPKRNYGKES